MFIGPPRIVVWVGKGAATVVGASVVGRAAMGVWGIKRSRERKRTQALLDGLGKASAPAAETIVDVDALAPPPLGAPPAAAPPLAVAPPPPPPPPPAAPKPKGVIGNLFKKAAASKVPTVDELCAGGGDQAELCKTIAWALRAPVDVAAAAQRAAAATSSDDLDGPSSLALEILQVLGTLHALTHSRTHSLTHTKARTHARTHTYIHTHARTLTHAHSRTHTHAHAPTHSLTHTQTPHTQLCLLHSQL